MGAKLQYSCWSKYGTYLACIGEAEDGDPLVAEDVYLTIFHMTSSTPSQEISGRCRPLINFAEGPCYNFVFVESGPIPELVLCFGQMDSGCSDIRFVDASSLDVLWSGSVELPVLYPSHVLGVARPVS